MKKHFGHRLIKKAAKPLPYKSSPHGEEGPHQRRSGAFVSSTNAPLFPCTTSCLSYHSHPIRPYGPPSPKGEGCDTRLPSSKKGGEAALVNPSAPQVPSSRAKPRDLYCTAVICTHAPSLKRHLGASFFAFHSLTIYRSERRIPLLRPS